VQLIQRNEYSLREIERCMISRRNGDDYMRQVERLVRKAVVFTPEENRCISVPGEREKVGGALRCIEQLALCRAPSRSEPRNTNTIPNRGFEIVVMLDRFDQFVRVMRDPDEAIAIICNRPHEPERVNPHVLHRANRRADIDGILRFVENDFDVVEK
jgi:hypothetical protein